MNLKEHAAELVSLLLDGEIDPKELAKGAKDEREEHDMSLKKSEKTARQHLTRVDPKYYTKVEKCLGSNRREHTVPKATVLGDTTTIGMAAGGS